MKLYLAVTPDEYELPIYVCDSGKELAEKLGVSQSTIYTLIAHDRDGSRTGRKVIKVEI